MPSALMRRSIAATTVATMATSTHHVFRLGYDLLPAAIAVVALPIGLMLWLHATGNRIAAWAYTATTVLVFLWFGFVDGFLDHVLKALGLTNTTFLPGGQAEIVHTDLSLWSPTAGDVFYEGTGVLTFIASVAALYYAVTLLRTLHRQPTTTPAATNHV
jgi:hypothetical protein